MEILIIGTNENLREASVKFGDHHHYTLREDHYFAADQLNLYDVVFDFIISEKPSAIKTYDHTSPVIFLNTSFITLSALGVDELKGTFFGFCGMLTFLNREMLEVSVPRDARISTLKDVCEKLNTGYQVVQDKVGLVTPRVICMIINEAFYTVEEGTATREDIDKAMKLGTNYPFGPFEWCDKIGSGNVCKLLDAVRRDTEESRYSVCPALRNQGV